MKDNEIPIRLSELSSPHEKVLIHGHKSLMKLNDVKTFDVEVSFSFIK